MTIDLRERQYVSQYGQDVLGLVVHKAGVPASADGDVTVTLTNETTTTDVFTDSVATEGDTGHYGVTLTSADTQTPGYYTVRWDYEVDAVPTFLVGYVEVGPSQPDYDNLDNGIKDIVDSVLIRFADCFDSPSGGPNLQTYFQTHWGRGRIAQLARIAVGRLNTMSQPFQTYTIDTNGQFPITQYGPLLESMTYVECLRHLIRSYVEQPNLQGGSVTRLDRRDYMDRWRQIMDDEEKVLKSQLDVFKIRNMGFGRPKVLVSGGVYGRYGPTRFAGSVAARPRYWTRFY